MGVNIHVCLYLLVILIPVHQVSVGQDGTQMEHSRKPLTATRYIIWPVYPSKAQQCLLFSQKSQWVSHLRSTQSGIGFGCAVTVDVVLSSTNIHSPQVQEKSQYYSFAISINSQAYCMFIFVNDTYFFSLSFCSLFYLLVSIYFLIGPQRKTQ